MPLVNPIIEIKNVKFHKGHEGMTGLNADIYVDGRRIAHVYDDAHGGEFQYDAHWEKSDKDYSKMREKRDVLNELYIYARSLPEYDTPYGKLPMNLDTLVNKIIRDKEIEKEMNKGILLGKDLTSYSILKSRVKKLIDMTQGERQALYFSAKKYCKGEVKILNTNLKELGIKI